jgi:Sulfotransferase family
MVHEDKHTFDSTSPDIAPQIPYTLETPQKKTFFLHIPRCGGGTIWNALTEIYGQHNVYRVSVAEEATALWAMTFERRRSYSAIGGHESLRFFNQALRDLNDYHKILTLRDPIDRLVSEYNYARLHDISLAEFSYAKSVSLNEYIGHAPRNVQVFTLTGSRSDASAAAEVIENVFNDWALSSEIDELLVRLAQELGISFHSFYPENRTPEGAAKRGDLSEDIIEIAMRRHSADLELIDILTAKRGTSNSAAGCG